MSFSTADERFFDWCTDFYAAAQPTPQAFGLTPDNLVEFNTTLTRYGEALAKARAPETRTRVTIEQKQIAKKTLLNAARMLSNICNNWPQMTNDKRILLGLTPRKARKTRIDVPTLAPIVEIVSVRANVVEVIARNPQSGRRDKPKGSRAVAYYSFAGDEAPADPNEMRIEATLTKTSTKIVFPTSMEPFTKVWISACYNNPRGQAGPGSTPVATNLGTWAARNVPAQKSDPAQQAVKIAA